MGFIFPVYLPIFFDRFALDSKHVFWTAQNVFFIWIQLNFLEKMFISEKEDCDHFENDQILTLPPKIVLKKKIEFLFSINQASAIVKVFHNIIYWCKLISWLPNKHMGL